MGAETKIEWAADGRALGSLKTAARRVGLELEDYLAHRAAGLKYCTACKTWHAREAFGADRHRGDGLAAHCRRSRHTGRPRGWSARPKINPRTGRPGPAPIPARDGDKVQARQKVNLEVRSGRMARPDSLPCADCGALWAPGRPRHEYDHHRGYAADHHLDVQAVCAPCHHSREEARRGD